MRTKLRAAALAAAVALSGWSAVGAAAAPSPDRQREILRLLRQDCGSCHGLTLKGGLGPALTPAALAGKPPEALRETILRGRHGTPMAPWRPFLDETEADWLVRRLRHGATHAP